MRKDAPSPSVAPGPPPAVIVRGLMRALDRASLATFGRADSPAAGAPYVSLVLVAVDHDATPILLISRLADHTRNLMADPSAALLFDGTAGLAEPLTGPRATLIGRAEPSDDARMRARFLARHPSASLYADFKDFAVWRVVPAHAHLVAGFGRIHWLPASDVRFDPTQAAALIAHEGEIVAHMNSDHGEAIDLYASRLLGRAGGGWRMTGIDPEGADLRRAGEVARLAFAAPVTDPELARAELVRLARLARAD